MPGNVMVVEDDSQLCDILTRFIAESGFQIRGVRSAREAIAYAIRLLPEPGSPAIRTIEPLPADGRQPTREESSFQMGLDTNEDFFLLEGFRDVIDSPRFEALDDTLQVVTCRKEDDVEQDQIDVLPFPIEQLQPLASVDGDQRRVAPLAASMC